MPVNTKMNFMWSYLPILSIHIWFPLIDVGAIPEQVWNCLMCMGHVWALTTTSSRLTSPLQPILIGSGTRTFHRRCYGLGCDEILFGLVFS
jgi:hypothetical protein